MLAHVELPWLDFLINNTVLTLNVLKELSVYKVKIKSPPYVIEDQGRKEGLTNNYVLCLYTNHYHNTA